MARKNPANRSTVKRTAAAVAKKTTAAADQGKTPEQRIAEAMKTGNAELVAQVRAELGR